MGTMANIEPVDYLLIGHITQDITSKGSKPGGTATYSALTAKALGLKVGVITSNAPGLILPEEYSGIQVLCQPAQQNTTFENIYTKDGRIQFLHCAALKLDFSMVPDCWKNAPIVHLGPVANEVDPVLAGCFPHSLVGLTLQGWMRAADESGRIHYTPHPAVKTMLQTAAAAVISIEDLENDEKRIDKMVSTAAILAVTDGSFGARVYWNGDQRRFHPPAVSEVDPTGAGDIFAAVFFYSLYKTRDPWEAARFATRLAAYSVTRPGLQGIPTPSEIESCMVEILSGI